MFFGWQQTPLSPDEMRRVAKEATRERSIRAKILLIIAAALVIFGFASALISYQVYMNTSIEQHKKLADGAANLAASVIDPAKINEYLEKGELAEGYFDAKNRLSRIRESSMDIQYLYVYKIEPDGCHVVFDLDTAEMEGDKPGEVVPFEEAIEKYVPDLLEGKKIEVYFSKDDEYGEMLTAYAPISYNGVCQAYAAADVSIDELRVQSRAYLLKLLLIFAVILAAILLVVLRVAKYSLILPINTMAHASSDFAYHSEEAMEKSLDGIKRIGIRTGDEIENLYNAFGKMTEDSVKYMQDAKAKTDTITKMQHALIMALAEMVESRDENTGQHIRKTAAYVRIVMEEMKREGIYADKMTDEFIENVTNSAPLHDIGKISVPDSILCKPGKLTDEEFEIMKTHTTAGGKLIDSILRKVPESTYLNDAKNLAIYHHEKWNGKGYPSGLSGEDIPLSARIMAVADVFDALVSKRSYKEGFPYDKALKIIREESGAQFDPKIVDAFFASQEAILKVADEFGENQSA